MAKGLFTITADVQDAVKALNGLQDSLSGAATAIKSLAVAAGVFVAIDKIAETLHESVAAASESQDAIQKLNTTLASTGGFTQDASDNFQELARSIQKTTVFSDEAVLASISLGKQYGLTNKEAEKLTQASVELAAATRVDLNTATTQLAQTLDGTAGRLAQQIPALQGLTEAQLKNAGALDIVIAQYKGFAEAQANTFSGAIAKTKNQFGELLESIGKVIIENPVIISAVKQLAGFFESLAKTVERNKGVLSSFVSEGLVGIVSAIAPVSDALAFLLKLLRGVVQGVGFLVVGMQQLSAAIASFTGLNTIFAEIYKGVLGALQLIVELTEKLVKIPAVGSTLKNLGFDTKELKDFLRDANNTLVDQFAKTNAETIANARQKVIEGTKAVFAATDAGFAKTIGALGSLKGISQTIAKSLDEASKKTFKIATPKNLEFKLTIGAGEVEKLTAAANKDFAKFLVDFSNASKKDRDKSGFNLAASISGIAGASNLLQKGAKGAADFMSQIAGQIGEKILPGLGSAVAQIFSFLAQGPDKVREQITAFADAIPGIIQNVVEAIPAVIIALANKIPEVIDRLIANIPRIVNAFIDKIPDIIIALAKSMPRVSLALALEMPRVAITLASELIKRAPEIAVEFVNQLVKEAPRFISELIKEIPNAIGGAGKGIVGSVASPGGLGGFLGGTIGAIGDIFGFAEGGTIPNIGRFQNDGAIIRASAGENIIDRSTNEKLDAFLSQQSGGGSAQNLTVNLVVGEQQLAQVLLNLNRQGFRVS